VLYRLLYTLVLRWIPPEQAHTLGVLAMRLVARLPGARAALAPPPDPRLRVRALGLEFPNPLGVAAGVDKNAAWFGELGTLGFGFVEVGTVTARAQDGTPRPRVWRLTRERGLVNRMGFPNGGAEAAAARLARPRDAGLVVAVNVGKSRDVALEAAPEDYRATVRRVAREAEFLVLNVSSPNTPGLRAMQAVEPLRALVRAVRDELASLGLARPVLVKISGDMPSEEIDAVGDLAVDEGIDGIVAVNTTVDRRVLHDAAAAEGTEGGISGAPLRPRALEVLRRLRARVGDRVVLVSVGGVESGADVWDRLRAGATLVESYTGFVYGGPGWPRRILRDLSSRLDGAGLASVQDVVGRGAPEPAAA
jgi:dihydroorotate dehydrogenase